MSEYGTQVSVARLRAGLGGSTAAAASTDTTSGDEARIRALLAEVPDPELPVVSIVDLGIVHTVTVDADGVEVAILPTFLGCPALELIRTAVEERLASPGRRVRVVVSHEVPWTTERISPIGRERLRSAGIAPAAEPADVRCPYCASPSVVMDAAFGPTPCRALFYCRACRQPFEAMKPV